MATDWSPINEIDVYNGDLIVAITEVIEGITIPTENHLILLEHLFRLNSKQLDIKL
jgi:hypothetical protein